MPVTTPQIKVDAVARARREVVLHGDSYDDAYARRDADRKRRAGSPSCIRTTTRT